MRRVSKILSGFCALGLGVFCFLQGEVSSVIEFECIGISDVTVLMKAVAASNEQFIFNHVFTSAEVTNNDTGDTQIVQFTITINDTSVDGSVNAIRIDSIYSSSTTMQMLHQGDPNVLVNLVVTTNKNATGVVALTTLTQSSIVCNSIPGNRASNREYVITVYAAQDQLKNTAPAYTAPDGVYTTLLEFSITNG